jgi:hypothetical protein
MMRSLIISSFAIVLLATLSMPFLILHPGGFVLGGRHHITPATALEKDISFYFAQEAVDEGALVKGHIFLNSSTLDLHGHVTEDIHAFESNVILHETVLVDGKIDQKDIIHWTLLLPAIVQIP